MGYYFIRLERNVNVEGLLEKLQEEIELYLFGGDIP